MKCAACGTDTPRLTISQRYCPDCDRRIRAKIAPRRRRSVETADGFTITSGPEGVTVRETR